MGENIQVKSRPGRSKLIGSSTGRVINRAVNQDRFISSKDLLEKISELTVALLISPKTVRRFLHEKDLHGRVARKKPFISKANKKTACICQKVY